MIHPAAHVSPQAVLGRGVRIGPGAVVDAGCEIGEGCDIRANAIVTGKTVMGSRNQIGYGAVIGGEPQDLSFQNVESRVVLGRGKVIRENVTIHRGTSQGSETVLGNDNYLMAGAHVAHNCHLGNKIILVNQVLLAGYVTVEDQAFLGGNAIVHQKCRIGRLAIMQGGAGISKDLPPYFMAGGDNTVVGLNVVGLRRAGFDAAARARIKQAFRLLYRSGLNLKQALAEMEATLEGPEILALRTFIQNSARGICGGRSRQSNVESEG
jgi:UDP-N-acetylglucosamine acyltransferase